MNRSHWAVALAAATVLSCLPGCDAGGKPAEPKFNGPANPALVAPGKEPVKDQTAGKELQMPR
jgi:hypothetical protein